MIGTNPGSSERTISATLVARWLSVLVAPGQAFELRAVGVRQRYGNPATEAGYFSSPDVEEAARLALEVTARAKGTYFTLNPVPDALLAVRHRRLERAAEGELTKDKDVLCRRWLLLDVDSVRPSKLVSATDEEKAAAEATADSVRDFLDRRGWPAPVFVDSGNGFYLLYRIDLPADDGGLVKAVLEALAGQFDDGGAEIDKTVFNPSRIAKVPGTWGRKGDDCPELGRPHRQSAVLSIPGCDDPLTTDGACVEAVREDQLRDLVADFSPTPADPDPDTHKANGTSNGAGARFKDRATGGGKLDVEMYLRARNVAFRRKGQADAQGRAVWPVTCPFDDSHAAPDAAVFQWPDGKLGFKCLHNSCRGRDWKAFRDKVGAPSPDHYEGFTASSSNSSANQGQRSQDQAGASQGGRGLVLRRLDTIRPRPVKWLVPGYIPRGKLVLLAGDGGHGKSLLTLHLTAGLTAGFSCFGASYVPPPPCDVLLVCCEDDFGDTVVPRLIAAGANRSRIHSVEGIKGPDGSALPFNLQHYARVEEELADNPNIRLVVIDPIGAFVGRTGVDDHKDSDLRALLGPMGELAARRDVTMLLVKHFNKATSAKAVHRVGGSVGYVNAVRAAFVVVPDAEDEGKKYFLPLKFNIAAKPRGRCFTVGQVPDAEHRSEMLRPFTELTGEDREHLEGQLVRIQWHGEADLDADQALADQARRNGNKSNKVEECTEWLRTFLEEHAYPSDEILAAAKAKGFTFDNLKEAKARLKEDGVRHSNKGRFQGRWWSGFGPPDSWTLRPESPHSPESPDSPHNGEAADAHSGETGESGD